MRLSHIGFPVSLTLCLLSFRSLFMYLHNHKPSGIMKNISLKVASYTPDTV